LRTMNDNTRFIRRPRFGVAPPQLDQKMSGCSRNLPQAEVFPWPARDGPVEQPNPGGTPGDAQGAAAPPGEGCEGLRGNPPAAGQPQQKQKRLLGPGGPRRRSPPRTEAHQPQSN
jgi:hypothetical protein